MPIESLKFQAIKRQADAPDEIGRSFEIKVDRESFGLLHLSSQSCTVSWKGRVDFKNLEDEAFQCLSISTRRKQLVTLRQQIRQDLHVSLVLREGSADELIECKLGDRQDLTKYRKLLKSPESIAFARYDYEPHDPGREHSLIAENPHAIKEPDVAIKRPVQAPFTRTLFDWILKHHRSENFLRDKLDARTSADSIGAFLKQCKNH